MPSRDPRVDSYIAAAAPFAQPILRHIRAAVHEADPAIEETMKWSFPHFTHEGIVCSMAAFRQHCTLTFWKGALVLPDRPPVGEKAMGQFGRIASIEDLPPRDVLIGHVRDAVRLNVAGVTAPRQRRPRAPEVAVPEDLRIALEAHPAAAAAWARFSPSHRREYVEWITEAKRAETRARRVATALEWLAEGKSRNWKYEAKR